MLVEIGSISATFYCPCCRAVKSGEFRCWSASWLKWLGCCWVFMVVLLRRQKQQWVAIPHRLYKPTGLMSTATAQRHQQQHQQPSTRPFFPAAIAKWIDWCCSLIGPQRQSFDLAAHVPSAMLLPMLLPHFQHERCTEKFWNNSCLFSRLLR